MVATRRSSTQHVDVELSLNGKEAKKVIPIAEQRKSSLKEYSSENDDNEEPSKPVKKETRGRKRKTITTDSTVMGESNAPKKKTTTTKNGAALGGHSIENVVDSSKFSQPPVDTIKKVETRGRKRKNPESSPNTTTTTTTTPRTTTTTTTTPRAASTSKTTASKTTSTPARGVNTRRKSAIASASNDNNASTGVGRSSKKTAISTNKGDTSSGVAASATQDTLGPISSPAITGSNVIAGINVNKHNINHLLTKDSPPPLGGLYGRHPGGVGGIGVPAVAVTSGAHNSYERSTSPAMASYQQQQQQQHLYQQQQHLQHTQPNFFNQQQQQQPQSQSQIHYQHHLQQPQQFHPAGTQLPPPPITTTRSQTNVVSQQAGGRIPITSIISQKIDASDIPLMMMEEDDTGPEDKKTKRRYRVDKDNIKINKRIMSQDTEDVIKMFKKFDDEILTNPEARQRLLSLGFETRKRYITTFKHFIRFCCRKKLDNFFVTGELMKEFYQEQFANSTSSKPVIRLRKMDPAFSKLQEINFLVYHLENKEIPNRHIALEYLVYKEIGKDSPPSSHSSVEETSSSETNSKKKRRMVKKIYKAQQLSGVAQNGGDEKQPTEASDIDEGLQSQDRAAAIGAPVPDSNNQFQQNPPFASSPLYQQQPVQYGQHLQAYSQQAVANLPHHEQPQQSQQQQPVSSSSSLSQLPHQSPSLQEPPIYTKKITKKNVEEIRKSFAELRQEIRYALQKTVAVDPAFVSSLSDRINGSLDRFELELNGPPPARQQQSESGVPIYDLNHEIYTVFEIVEEWYKIDPPIAQRIQQFGEDWIRDEIDHNTFTERRSIVEFVEKMAKECNVDIYVIANDCDRYIRDKSILDEFISEIELDYDDLYKRIMRYRQRRS